MGKNNLKFSLFRPGGNDTCLIKGIPQTRKEQKK